MMKKVLPAFLILIFIASSVNAAFTLYDTETFGGKLEATAQPQLTFTTFSTLTFGGKLEATGTASEVDTPPYFDSPSPANNSNNQELVVNFTVDITDDEGDLTDWHLSILDVDNTGNSNDTATINVSGLSYNTEYTVHCYANDTNNMTYQFYTFTTKENNLSEISSPSPANESTDIALEPTLSITVNDHDGDSMDVSWYWGTTASCSNYIMTNNSVNNGTYIFSDSNNDANFSSYGTKYYWKIIVNDGNDTNESVYQFTTEGNVAPSIDDTNPVNETTGVSVNIDMFYFNLTDSNGDNMNYSYGYFIEGCALQGTSASSVTTGSHSFIVNVGACCPLSYSTQYTWWLNVTDDDTYTNETFVFTTEAEATTTFTAYDTLTFGGYLDVTDSNPVLSNENPTNESTGETGYPQLSLTLTDPNGLNMDISWSTNATGTWTYTNTTVASGSTVYQNATFANTSETTYWWTVEVNNSNGEWTNETYHFTLDNYTWGEWSGWWEMYYGSTPAVTNVNPANGTGGQETSFTWQCDINNSDGENFDWTIECNNSQTNSSNNDINGTKNLTISGLEINTEYTVYVNATSTLDATYVVNEFYTFNTGENNATVFSNENPSNGSIDQLQAFTWNVTIEDQDGDTFNWTIECNGQSNSSNDDTNGSKEISLTGLINNTEYTVYVNATDGYIYTREWFTFTTRSGVNNPNVVTTAATGVEEATATVNGNLVSGGGELCDAWIQYGTTTAFGSKTANESLLTGTYSADITGLTPAQIYHYRARANNSNGMDNASNLTFLTKPSAPSSIVLSVTNFTIINVSWTSATYGNYTYVERHTSNNFSRGEGTEVYNGTNSSFDDTGLTNGTTYYYQVWSYATWEYNGTTHHQYSDVILTDHATTWEVGTPTNGNADYNGGTQLLTLTWTAGNNSNWSVVVKKDTGYPSSPSDGTQVQANGSTTYTETISDLAYYSIFGYNSTAAEYSSTALELTWGAVNISVYKETNPTIAITNYTLFITNQEGTETYESTNNNNPTVIGVDDVPNGANIAIRVSRDGYKTRTQYWDLYENNLYGLNFYLPPSTSGGGTPGEPDYIPPTDPDDPNYNYSDVQNESYAYLYLLTVENAQDSPVPDATMEIKRYINTTGNYDFVARRITDGNGQIDIQLVPGDLYKVIINASGYETETADYIPSDSIYTKTFRLDFDEDEQDLPDNPVECINFTAEISDTTLYVNSSNNCGGNITDFQVFVYERNNTNVTFFGEDECTSGCSSYGLTFTSVNSSNTYRIIIHYNHSYYGNMTLTLIIEGESAYNPPTTGEEVDDLFEVLFGNNPFGWHNIIMWVFLCIVLFYADQKDAGMILVLYGGISLFINIGIGISTWFTLAAGGALPILFIVVGILIMWKNSNKKR